MAIEVADLVARLRLDAGEFAKGFKEADKSLMGLIAGGTALGEVFVQLGAMALDAMKAVVSFPLEAAKAAGVAAEQFSQLSQRTGIAVVALQGLQVAMAREGLETAALAQGFRTLSGHMVGLANSTKESVELFDQLGISAETVAQGTGATLAAIADKFAGMADGAEKSRFAVELFGRAGLQLIPILNQGAAGLDAAMKKAAEFGLILTQTQQESLTTFDDAMDDLGSAMKGFTAQVGAAFAPSLTALVRAMTAAVVFAKDTFNLFADAGEKLSIRLGAMAAALSVVAQQLFSFSIFSKEAWKQTLDQVKAIDAWAAAQLKAVDATRAQSASLDEVAKAHLKTGEAVKSHADHQKVLGEQIVAATKIQLHQIELLGASQQRRGEAIVAASRIEYAQRLEDNRKFWQALFDQEAEASRVNYLNGPEAGKGSQSLLAQNAIAQAQLVQRITAEANQQRLADAKMTADGELALQTAVYRNQINLFADTDAIRAAAANQIQADLAIKRAAETAYYNEGKLTAAQYQQHLTALEQQATAQRMGIAAQYPTFFEKQMQSLVASNTFSLAQMSTSFTNATAQWIVTGQNFTAFWQSLQITIVQAFLNTLVQMMAEYVLHSAAMKAGAAALETAKTAIFGVGESARLTTATVTSKAFGALMLGQLAAVSALAMGMISLMAAVVGVVVSMMGAIASALLAGVVTAPLAGPVTAAAIGLAIAGGAAVTAGTAAIAAASTAAGTVITGALALAKGGIVTQPTLALIGEAGPEAVVPLNRGGFGGGQTIIVQLDEAVLMRATVRGLPHYVRLHTGRA